MSKKTLEIVVKKGIVEALFQSAKFILDHAVSYTKIFFLNLRGYRISYSVLLRGDNTFFQSVSDSIVIGSGATIGKGSRITSGGRGKLTIGRDVLVDDYSFVMAQEKIEIGKNTAIAAFCFITDFNHKFDNPDISVIKQESETKPVFIGKNVWIGTHCIILPGVKIGDGSVIGAGSIVTRDIPSDSIAVGSPAKVIKKIQRKSEKK